MPHSFGLRARTRDLFKRGFQQNGPTHLSDYMTTYRVGDVVDIKCNASIHGGMPHKFYHGKTGTVWNVTKRAVGVEVNKKVGNRIIPKRVHIRIEHVKPSRSRDDFLKRVQANDAARAAAKAAGKKVSLKRQPQQPRPGKIVRAKDVTTVQPLKYELLA
eukprot:CAMPEP_0177660140 /NCGR_PEP_ID=MMETSP0447-20121125/17849_1 /TAXON_ID=0 /ORGANISM="Stygamoeba regulata, Strain BSH-02190019" /LENGTH=158 /DNA_ID=CAMNT_0019165121 /DNA_START=94 /DNA_END=570 /DNA_ORIENTATION=-